LKENLRKKDIDYIWHPYTEISNLEKSNFPIIDKAEGCYLYDMNGKALMDGIASWWCVNLGHSHPRLIKVIQEQAQKLQHVILGGMSHPNVIKLAEKLAQITPKGLKHSFFASDGASVVEASLRMALQYWKNIGEQERTKFISLQDGYHGDTLGAIGVGYVELFHKELEEVIHKSYKAKSPHCAKCPFNRHPDSCDVECFDSMAGLIKQHHKETAAVIIEPLCQGAAGIRIYREEYLSRLRTLCDEYNLLLIADEIAVGFGRTGQMFACEKAGISPDIMTLGKGMTGGYLPMSVSITNDRIYDSFRDGKTFYHGHTYCGNPITSALALEALSVYDEEKILSKITPLIRQLDEGIHRLVSLLPKSFASTMGMIAKIEISEEEGGAKRAKQITGKALQMGLFIRPLGPVVYLWPPLIVTPDELDKMINLLKEAILHTK
jgi:adenosylmethionine-8-amino-7-oxononanoate aminotransferase